MALVSPDGMAELAAAFGDKLRPALMAYQGSWMADLFL